MLNLKILTSYWWSFKSEENYLFCGEENGLKFMIILLFLIIWVPYPCFHHACVHVSSLLMAILGPGDPQYCPWCHWGPHEVRGRAAPGISAPSLLTCLTWWAKMEWSFLTGQIIVWLSPYKVYHIVTNMWEDPDKCFAVTELFKIFPLCQPASGSWCWSPAKTGLRSRLLMRWECDPVIRASYDWCIAWLIWAAFIRRHASSASIQRP